MRDVYDSDDEIHRFQTCIDLARGCKAFRYKLTIDERQRRLSRWRLRIYIGVIVGLEFLFVLISVLLAPQIICAAIQETPKTCRQSVKGAQTLIGVYTTVFFVWGVVVAVLIYSMCRRRQQDVRKDRMRKPKKEMATMMKGPQKSLQSSSPQIRRGTTENMNHTSADERQLRGENASESTEASLAHETDIGAQPSTTDGHEQENGGDLGTHPMVVDGLAAAPLSRPPPPYSSLDSRVKDTSTSITGIQSAPNPGRLPLDDHEIQRMFHSRMYPDRHWDGRRGPG